MTKHEKLVVSAYTGFLMCDFDDLHAYIENVLGRPVFTHELASNLLTRELREKLKSEFLVLCGSDS